MLFLKHFTYKLFHTKITSTVNLINTIKHKYIIKSFLTEEKPVNSLYTVCKHFHFPK